MPTTPHDITSDTGDAAALKAAWNADTNKRPEDNSSRQAYPTKTGPLWPTTTTNTEGVG